MINCWVKVLTNKDTEQHAKCASSSKQTRRLCLRLHAGGLLGLCILTLGAASLKGQSNQWARAQDSGVVLQESISTSDDGTIIRKSLWRRKNHLTPYIIEDTIPSAKAKGDHTARICYPANRVLVSIDARLLARMRADGLSVRPIGPKSNATAAIVTTSGPYDVNCVQDFISHLQQRYGPGLTVEPDHLLTGLDSPLPNDPDSGLQWAIENRGVGDATFGFDLNLDALYQQTTDARGVPIAIVDSGIALNHPEFSDQLWANPNEIPNNGIDDDNNGYIDDIHGWDFVDLDNEADDLAGHGTHISGIIGARGDNATGITGVAWRAEIIPLKFLDGNLEGSTSDAIAAIRYATDAGARVINLSWGTTAANTLLLDALRDASNQGIVLVAAAGNSNRDLEFFPLYPASFNLDRLVPVAATDSRGFLSKGSNYGLEEVTLAAPGRSIWSTDLNDGYRYRTGTSMAAPQVSAVVALLMAATTADADEIIAALKSTARPLRGEPKVGRGQIDASRALRELAPGQDIAPLPARWQLRYQLNHEIKNLPNASMIEAMQGLPAGLTFPGEPKEISGRPIAAGLFTTQYQAIGSATWHEIEFQVRADLNDWWEDYFPGQDLEEAFSRDTDNDSHRDILEYVTGASPIARQADAQNLLNINPGSETGMLLSVDPQLDREADGDWATGRYIGGLRLTLQWSPDLADWHSLPAENAQRVAGEDSGQWQITPPASVANGDEPGFFRVRIERP